MRCPKTPVSFLKVSAGGCRTKPNSLDHQSHWYSYEVDALVVFPDTNMRTSLVDLTKLKSPSGDQNNLRVFEDQLQFIGISVTLFVVDRKSEVYNALALSQCVWEWH